MRGWGWLCFPWVSPSGSQRNGKSSGLPPLRETGNPHTGDCRRQRKSTPATYSPKHGGDRTRKLSGMRLRESAAPVPFGR